MTISVLTDNCAGSGFLAEHGLSYLIESMGRRVLFDTGCTDVFLRNAMQLGMDLDSQIDTLVLSHGHWDHGNGLRYLNDKKLVLHPAALIKRYRKYDHSPVGLALAETDLEKRFSLIKSEEPFEITKNLLFLGEIPRLTKFESQNTAFVDEFNEPDFLPDDSGLVCIENEKLYVISGCAHSGIVNMVQHAIHVTGISRVEAVMGGFHLSHNNQQTRETIHYLRKMGVKKLYPSHCTQLPALLAFSGEWELSQVKTGMVLEF